MVHIIILLFPLAAAGFISVRRRLVSFSARAGRGERASALMF